MHSAQEEIAMLEKPLHHQMTPAQKFLILVENLRPTCIEDLRCKGFNFRFLAEGAYRRTYDIRFGNKSLGIVIKFPFGHSKYYRRAARNHARAEMRAIFHINSTESTLPLRRYMPEILYSDYGRGVVVMPKYRRCCWMFHFYGFVQAFNNLLDDVIPQMRCVFDDGYANFGLQIDKQGNEQYVLLDAGLLGEWRKPRK